ncbi:MAG: hypothetical protein Q7R60_01935 [bacterium]|nr:hypothetical protein [bacterium]
MENDINVLYEFVDRAVKNRKYPPTTSQALKAALKSFDSELTDEERKSIKTFRNNIDQIASTIYNKKGHSVSAASLSTYKSRALKVISDYEKYGTDPVKMTNWAPPKPVFRKKKISTMGAESPINDLPQEDGTSPIEVSLPAGMHKMELQLRPDTKFIFVLPYDLKTKEVTKIGAILKSLATDEGEDEVAGLQEAPDK